ncbi:hypothetical protein SIN09_07035, partial [Streptomyces sp. F8]|nr:hypothetical protein [Streptomyces sp. F8]
MVDPVRPPGRPGLPLGDGDGEPLGPPMTPELVPVSVPSLVPPRVVSGSQYSSHGLHGRPPPVDGDGDGGGELGGSDDGDWDGVTGAAG